MPRVLFPRTQRLPPNEHLELVCSVERTGVVGDVIFDLRHPKLDPTDWSAESLLRSEEDRRRYPGRPFLWFPWYGEYRLELSKSKSHSATKGQSLSGAKKMRLRKSFLLSKSFIPGDRISLRQIDPGDLTSLKMRDVVQGESVRLALLEITRTDGTIMSVETPLRFFSRHILIHRNSVDFVTSEIRTIVKNARNTREVRRIAEGGRACVKIALAYS